jgi:hypothetical protein
MKIHSAFLGAVPWAWTDQRTLLGELNGDRSSKMSVSTYKNTRCHNPADKERRTSKLQRDNSVYKLLWAFCSCTNFPAVNSYVLLKPPRSTRYLNRKQSIGRTVALKSRSPMTSFCEYIALLGGGCAPDTWWIRKTREEIPVSISAQLSIYSRQFCWLEVSLCRVLTPALLSEHSSALTLCAGKNIKYGAVYIYFWPLYWLNKWTPNKYLQWFY